jgi:hypothetical protein
MSYIARRRQLLLIILSTVLLLFSLATSGCDPGVELYVHNQTNHLVKMFICELPQVTVPPGKLERFATMEIPPKPDLPPAREKYLIEAKDEQGEVVYSREFTWQELDDMDWKITIPLLESN